MKMPEAMENMKVFQKGEPVERFGQKLESAEFTRAWLQNEQSLSPLHHPQVRAGLCLTAAALLASMLPWYAARYATILVPVCGVVLMLTLTFYFFREQPKILKKWAENVFQSNRLLSLAAQIAVYRDGLTAESERETLAAYWTDFARCLETPEFFILSGAPDRALLVLKKRELDAPRRAALSAFFADTFAGKYRQIRR